MTHPLIRCLGALLAAALVAGCATPPPNANISGTGVVQSIAEGREGDATKATVGAIGGALVGGWLGSQVGGGTGQTIATAAGATAGAAVGGSAAGNASATLVWHVSVRFEDGIDRVLVVRERPDFRPGDRVTVINGAISRTR
jgi:outer membrane lipoprotein SlyB